MLLNESCQLWCSTVSGLVFGLALYIVASWSKKKHNKPSSFTKGLLAEKLEAEEGCRKICLSLSTAKYTNDEAECAEQMRHIIMAFDLKYDTLASNPEHLLRANRHIHPSDHGALGTRFTVQYNLFGGSIVALGTDEQRQQLYDTQSRGELGCFAFTEKGAGVLSGAGVETIAKYDASRKLFVITSPTESSTKTWISQVCLICSSVRMMLQVAFLLFVHDVLIFVGCNVLYSKGMYAEHAVILASLIMPDGSDKGPHLFFSRIQNRNSKTGALTAVNNSIKITSLPTKTALLGLDNAYIAFDGFEVPRAQLLSRFSWVDEQGQYGQALPAGSRRMLDLLISRLLTGRVCLSEYTVAQAKVSLSVCRSASQ